jgi:UV excision repair protein RAD23
MIQLQVKTLSNEKFTIDCELTDSVRSIKEKIAATDFKDKYDVDAIKLIFSGKILEDAKTLDTYSIKEDSFIVVVRQNTGKNAPASGSAVNPPTAATGASAGSQPTRTPPTIRPSPTPAAPVRQPASPTAVGLPVPSQDSFLSAENRDKALSELTEMGFDRALAEQALRASFYHVERAAEYLLSGNIPTLHETPAQGGGGGGGQQQSQTPSGPGSQEGPTATRRTGGVDELADLSANPQFQALRQLIQQNPEQLQTLMQTLQATQPELFQMIEQRPQEFLELLNQVDEGDDGDDDDQLQGGPGGVAGGPGAHGPGTVTITLSQQDQQAINRLQDMGFERNRVIEAFLACDRNEEMAANYLLNSFD